MLCANCFSRFNGATFQSFSVENHWTSKIEATQINSTQQSINHVFELDAVHRWHIVNCLNNHKLYPFRMLELMDTKQYVLHNPQNGESLMRTTSFLHQSARPQSFRITYGNGASPDPVGREHPEQGYLCTNVFSDAIGYFYLYLYLGKKTQASTHTHTHKNKTPT